MFVMFVVGSVFLTFSLIFLGVNFYFARNGKVLFGRVFAIEKYQSTDNEGRSGNYYRVIIQYSFKGKDYLFSSSFGSSSCNYRINQKVKLLSLNKGPEYVRLTSSALWVVPSIFGIIGAGLVTFYLLKEENVEFIYFGIGGYLLLFFLFYNFLKKNNLTQSLIESLLKAKIEDESTLKNRFLFKTNASLEKELSKFETVGLIITSLFGALTGYGCYFFYEKLPEKSHRFIQQIMDDVFNSQLYEDLPRHPELIGTLVCGFFFALMIYSLIFQVIKSK